MDYEMGKCGYLAERKPDASDQIGRQERMSDMSEEPIGTPPPPIAPTGGVPPETAKLLAALGYPIWIVALIVILMDPYKQDPIIRHHAVQALGLNLAIWVLGVGTMWIGIGYFIYLAGFVYEVVCAVKAYNGEMFKMPVIYDMVKSYI